MEDARLRVEMCEVGRRLWERGLIGACEGNISARLSNGLILCTPSGLSKGHMKPDDLIVIDLQGERIGVELENPSILQSSNPAAAKPSSEIKLHLRILQKRPDCMAVVHAHPPIATALSVAGETIPDDILPESIYVLGRVVTVPFCMPGTNEVPDAIEPLVHDHKVFILSHHGAATMGKDLWDAYNRMETLERVARMTLIARLLGRAEPLPEAAMQVMSKALDGTL